MTDREVFHKYCDWMGIKKEYQIYNIAVTNTFSYKLFAMKIAMDELKQSIKDSISDIKKRLFK